MRLEVMVEWCGTVFEARHLGEGDAFHLGRDFPCDIEALVARMDGGEARVRLPVGAEGELLVGDTTQALAFDRPTRLAPGARARMQVGDLALYFATVEPAARLPRRPFALLDRQGAGGLGGALLLHVLAVLIIVAAPITADDLELLAAPLDDRFIIASMIPDEPEPPEPTEVADSDAPPGEQTGDPSETAEPDAPVANAPPGPKTNSNVAKALALNTAQNVGQEINSMFADADAPRLDEGGWVLGDDTPGGPGNPFAALGPPAGAGGFGPPAVSENVQLVTRPAPPGISGVRPRYRRTPKAPKPVVIPGDPRVAPGLEREQVRRVVRRYRAQTRACYEKRLQVTPGLNGKIRMKFVVGPSGGVIAAAVESSTMNDAQVEGCIRRRILRWQFPRPSGGGTVAVRYPFLFKESG